jgi:putative peptide zinc metalloprotease protein
MPAPSEEKADWPWKPPQLANARPVLVADTQLLGRYESPGMTDERYLVRRADGQVILLTFVLYVIVTDLAQNYDLEHVAFDISERLGQTVDATTVAEVIDIRLKPMGILASPEKVPARQSPVLSLTMKGTLVPPRVVRFLSRVFRPLYWPVTVVCALVLLVVADYHTFFVVGVSDALAQMQIKPLSILPVFGLVVVSTVFHEIGHATACAYGGASRVV